MNINSLNNKNYKIFEFAIIQLYFLENNNKIILIKPEKYFIYSLSISIFITINTINPEEVFLDDQRDRIISSFYSIIKVLATIIPESNIIFVIICSIKNILFPP